MPLILTAKPETAPLRRRLSRMRERWRGRIALQYGGMVVAGLMAFFVLSGIADFALHLPAMIRAIALVAILIGTYWFIRSRFARSWSALGSDFDVALQIEEHFPEFNDSLASTVQFSDSHVTGSSALRSATERRAMRGAAECEFESILPATKPLAAIGSAAVLTTIVAIFAVLAPEMSGVAATRIIDPFGDHPWPPATRMAIEAPARLASGEPFLLHGELRGEIPDRVEFRFNLDGAAPTIFALPVITDDDAGAFAVRLEPNRIPRSFRFQVAANDAVTPLTLVAVLRPPELTLLNGRPSPQIHLDYPRYTRLPPSDLPDGGGTIEAVAGTTVTIRAAVDRPVRSAQLELTDDTPVRFSAVTAAIGAGDHWTTIAGLAAATTTVGGVAARVENDGMQFELGTIPMIGGRHLLRFTDADGLSGRRALDFRLTPDPSPSVQLERPAAGREMLSVLPDAVIDLAARIDDPVFAIRSIWLEHRKVIDGTAGMTPLRDLRPNPEAHATIAHHLELKSLPLDRPLRDGDVLILAIAANDFDDVTPTKAPGRSHEVELHIVSPAGLAALLQKTQSEIQKELGALHLLQQLARELAESVDAARRLTGSLGREDRERLSQASQLQQQIRQRTGDGRDGLRGSLEQLRQTLRNNSQPGSQAERDRADAVASELERLAQETLAAIEPLLAVARGEQQTTPSDRRATGALPDAIRHQRDAERTLHELAGRMGAWSEARELRAEAGLVERELARLAKQREQLEQQPGVRGARPAELTGAQRTELGRLAEQQSTLADRANELAQRLAKKTADKQGQAAKAASDETSESEKVDAAEQLRVEAAALAKARDRSQSPPSVAAAMQAAAKSISANRHGEAAAQQQTAEQALRDIQAALAEVTEQNVDRLARRLKEAEDAVETLLDEQERLQKRAFEVRASADTPVRRAALEQSAKDQDNLRERADELAQRLTRLNQETAAREMRGAAKAMEKARAQIESSEPAGDQQDDALDRLDDASKELADARQKLDGELQRERQAQSLERLRGFLRRQMDLAVESERLFQSAKSGGGWTRGLQKSLIDLAQSERALADEIGRFAGGSWRESRVIAHWLHDAARLMTDCAGAVETARAGPLDMDTWNDDRREIQSPQAAAEQRLRQLIDAIHNAEKEQAKRSSQEKSPDKPESGGQVGNPDSLPPEVQWKLLRTLQAELNEQTITFAREHPEPTRWTPANRKVLADLQGSQAGLFALLEALSAGETPTEPQKEGKK